jgi:hypothetical protein
MCSTCCPKVQSSSPGNRPPGCSAVADWILINGAKIDRAAFEANYVRANDHAWEKIALGRDAEPRSCLICGAGVPGEAATVAYTSAVGILCAPCFNRFVGPSTPP